MYCCDIQKDDQWVGGVKQSVAQYACCGTHMGVLYAASYIPVTCGWTSCDLWHLMISLSIIMLKDIKIWDYVATYFFLLIILIAIFIFNQGWLKILETLGTN